MGLAVLPARLKEELRNSGRIHIWKEKTSVPTKSSEKHAAWAESFLPKYQELNKENVHGILRRGSWNVFRHVLEDAGVYKCTPEGREAFMRFIDTL